MWIRCHVGQMLSVGEVERGDDVVADVGDGSFAESDFVSYGAEMVY